MGKVLIRMTTSSTAARMGEVVERQEAEAKRLIAAGYAEPHVDRVAEHEAKLKALEARIVALEGKGKGKGKK